MLCGAASERVCAQRIEKAASVHRGWKCWWDDVGSRRRQGSADSGQLSVSTVRTAEAERGHVVVKHCVYLLCRICYLRFRNDANRVTDS